MPAASVCVPGDSGWREKGWLMLMPLTNVLVGGWRSCGDGHSPCRRLQSLPVPVSADSTVLCCFDFFGV